MALVLVLFISALVLSCSGQTTDDYNSHECLGEDMFQCLEGSCVPYTKYCDGEMDCRDGSDETFCVPGQVHECGSHEFKCPNSSVCVERFQVCDGHEDCPGGVEELSSICEHLGCYPHEFMCKSGSCILLRFRCDGDKDCFDGSDEIDCQVETCHLGNFQCRNKQCIEMRRRCDGQQDCIDMSDEEECGPENDVIVEPPRHCEDGELACALNKTLCIPNTARCDMRVDCPGGTDETPEACAQANKTSIWSSPPLYPAAECHDGFLCGSGQCIEWRNVCDRLPHCIDNSDENGLCETACQNHSCSYSCQPTPQGPHCRCPEGLRTTADHRSCEDINECAHRSVCSQRCHNIPGSFICSCYHGYSLRSDRRTCKAYKGHMSFLYVSDNTIRSTAADGLTVDVYSDPEMAKIADISVDIRRNKLYVSFKEASKLIEVNSSKDHTVFTDVGEPEKVAVDWITGNMYFVDATVGDSYIRVCNVSKKRCARLQKLPFNCRVAALVVDPAAKRMFYCENRSGQSGVWSATLSGQYTTVLAAASDCTGLAVDTFAKRLYIAEGNPTRIISMDYKGEDQELIVYNHTDFQKLHSLTLFEDYIYFMKSGSRNLYRCSLFGKKNCNSFMHMAVEATTFVLRHESVQRDDVQDQCRDYSCVNLCVMDERGPVCLCDDGQPAHDGHCPLLEKEQQLLFNEWTYGIASIIIVLLLLYLGVLAYYRYKRGRCTPTITYMEYPPQNSVASPMGNNSEEA